MRRFAPGLLLAVSLVACGTDRSRPSSAGATSSTAAIGPAAIGPAAPPAPLPKARTEVAGALGARGIWVVGGMGADGGASARLDVYDLAANRWRAGPALDQGVHHAGVAGDGNAVYVAGGYTNEPGQPWRAVSVVATIDAPGDAPVRTLPALPEARGALALGLAGGRLVAVGGARDGHASKTTEILDLGASPLRWVRGPDLLQQREHLAAASDGTRVYAIGGRVELAGNLTTVESLDPVHPEAGWRREPDLLHARSGVGAAFVHGRLCVAGGEQPAGTIAEVECLDGGAWSDVTRLAVPRHGLAVVAVGDDLHVLGGGPTPGLSVSAVHEVLHL